MKKEEVKELLKKYHEGKCSEAEKALLEGWYLQYNEREINISPKRIEALGKQIFMELPGNHYDFIRIGLWLAVAATTIGILISVTLKFYGTNKQPKTLTHVRDIAPGSNKAILTLANGTKINLNDAANGQLTAHSGIKILKTADGQLIYKVTDVNILYDNIKPNNVTTPNGGQWQVHLSDGTKVWLNSASSLTYPSSFDKQKDRRVQLTGEAYFEVAKDKAHPFIVLTDQQEVEVLGTHFNINSYNDEPAVKTTLLEGSVKVITKTSQNIKFLSPGQQAVLANNILVVGQANMEEAVAWKNGYFRFNDEDIQSIMRKLSRWYNIDVVYQGDISKEGLNGKVSRFKNISQVLKALEATKTVHFKVEGRRVTVMK
jgi:transmembrane sensor